MFPLIPITPDPYLLPGLPIGWYGVLYVVGLTVMLMVSQGEAERRGIPRFHIWNALLIVGALAILGGRLYHVIDQWHIYSANPISIFLPPYAGLGLYGGVAGAALGIVIYTRWKGLPLRLSLDSVIAGTLFAQGIARWGNFFNQELYGPPTDLPWGIVIECAHRVAQYPCSIYPEATTGFHPLFFYESALNIIGGFVALYISRRYLAVLRPGDLAAFWGIWYGATRSLLEVFREGWNWTVGGIPTAQLVGIALIAVGVIWLAWNYRPGNPRYPYPEKQEPEDPFADEDEWDEEPDLDDEPDHDVKPAPQPSD